jgi:hypothetical protein
MRESIYYTSIVLRVSLVIHRLIIFDTRFSPDLFCTPDELVKIILNSGETGKTEYDRGVKIIHLVRNPFSMAVSNYHYHAQIPT